MKAKILLKLILFGVLISSCGIRDDDKILKSYLDGAWKLQEINCYKESQNPTETYQIPPSHIAVYNFDGGYLTYTVSPGCGITTKAQYNVAHYTLTSGGTAFFNVLGGGICSVSVLDDLGAGTSVISLEMTSSFTSNLLWAYVGGENKITLTHPTSFKGSSNNLFCNSKCTCIGELIPN